jgi:hypothetical protein
MFGARRLGQGLMGPRVRQALGLLADGRYAEAGTLFGQLADRARDNGHHLRAANLALQAGHAFLEAGDGEKSMLCSRQAVRQFIVGGRPGRAVRVLRQAMTALRARGLDAQAIALEQDAQARLAEIGLSLSNVPTEQSSPSQRHLPPMCPQCGGPLRADEVEWIDSSSAECPYCGSVVATKL